MALSRRYETPQLRNITIVGHGGTGKTSLAEAMLFCGKATTRLGSVDAGTSTFDFEPEEVRRKTSYASAVAGMEWKKVKVNIIDTPGDAVFSSDTRLCVFAGDTTLVTVSAVDHVQVGTERVWGIAADLGKPRFVVVTKLDKERADFDKTLAALRESFGQAVAPLTIPLGQEAGFKGVIDLVTLKAFTYAMDGSGEGRVGEVPADFQAAARAARDLLVEAVASADDVLIDHYLEQGTLTDEELTSGLRSAVARGALIPVLCVSCTRNAGVDTVLDHIAAYAPSPVEAPLPKATAPNGGQAVTLKPSNDAPFVGVVFKAIHLDMGKVSLIRVLQGKAEPDTNFVNVTRESHERWGQVLMPFGKRLDISTGANCGDIIAVAKLKEGVSGDVLAAERHEVRIEIPAVPGPIIAYAIRPKKKGDEDKLSTALLKVIEADPSLRQTRDAETKDHLLSGMGQTHIEVAVERMRRYGAEVELHPPRVGYRECIRRKVTHIEGKHKKQSGGRGQFGVVYLDVEPLERGAGFEFEDAIFGGSVPNQFIPAVEKGVREVLPKGVLGGYPIVDVKVRLTDGKFHPVDSDGRSFEIAGRKGFKEGFLACGPTFLEPIMALEVEVPDECMGDVMGDINSRRGRVQGMDTHGTRQVIKALVPQAEILFYAPDLHSMSQGRGTFTSTFSHYEEVPGNLVDKIAADHKAQEEEDE